MTQSRTTDFESGTNGSTFTLDTLANGAASVCTTAAAAHGTKSVKELGSGTYQYVQGNFATPAAAFRLRYAFAQDTQLTADGVDLELHSDTTSFGATNKALSVVRKSTGILRVLDATGATVHSFTNVLPTNSAFIVVELTGTCGTGGTASVSGRIYTSLAPNIILDNFGPVACTTTATVQSMHLGKVTTAAYTPSTGTTYHDDFAFDDVSSGWIGPVDTPLANAGGAQTNVEPYSTVTLDGSGSSDTGGLTLTYAWTQLGGTAVTLSSSTAQSPTFTAPATTLGDSLTFSLTVTNSASTVSTPSTTTAAVAAHTWWKVTNTTGPVLTPVRISIL